MRRKYVIISLICVMCVVVISQLLISFKLAVSRVSQFVATYMPTLRLGWIFPIRG